MAKKKPRSGKPVPGGRVTPKGVRPDEHKGHHDHVDGSATTAPPPPQPTRIDPARGGAPINQHAPTRAGHHRGQR